MTAAWFDSAVGAWGKAAAYAAELGVTEAFLSDLRTGARTVALWHCLPLLRDQAAARALLAPQLELAGLAPPAAKRRVSRARAQANIARRVRLIVELWKVLRPAVAAEEGTDEADVDAALDDEEGAA